MAKGWASGHVATTTTDQASVIKSSSKQVISLETVILINPIGICLIHSFTLQGTEAMQVNQYEEEVKDIYFPK